MSALLEKKCFSLKSEREKKRDENFFTSFFLSLSLCLSHLSDERSTQQKSLYSYKKEDVRMRERREEREEREKKTDFSKQKKNQQEKQNKNLKKSRTKTTSKFIRKNRRKEEKSCLSRTRKWSI